MTTKYTCLVCDDEPVARRILINYIEQTPFLELAGECENGLEVVAFLQNAMPDLLFLDVNMPVLDGINLLKTIKKRPKTILTTAYSEYALEAFDLDVSDYLVKPVAFERFLRAVSRAIEPVTATPSAKPDEPKPEMSETEHLVVRFGRLIHRVSFSDILFLEAQANAVKIVTSTQEYRTYQTLSTIETQLPTDLFVRTHRSFLVNRLRVSTLDGLSIVFLDDLRVPISENMRAVVLQRLGFGEGG
jgi:DNA-binding LytR/AlgR family response regulator